MRRNSLTALGAPALPRGYRYRVRFQTGRVVVEVWGGRWPFRVRHGYGERPVYAEGGQSYYEKQAVKAAEDAVIDWFSRASRKYLAGWWSG